MTVDDFEKQEESKMRWWDSVMFNYPDLKPTEFYASSMYYSSHKETVILRPSVLRMIMVSVFLLFAFRFWYLELYILVTNRQMFPILIFLLLFTTFIICYASWQTFFNPKVIYTVMVGRIGISVKGKKYLWNEIEQTYIMRRQEGKIINYYLILFLRKEQPVKLDFYKFSISHYKLSAIIEYYKAQSS